jgi:hypothetical protein
MISSKLGERGGAVPEVTDRSQIYAGLSGIPGEI